MAIFPLVVFPLVLKLNLVKCRQPLGCLVSTLGKTFDPSLAWKNVFKIKNDDDDDMNNNFVAQIQVKDRKIHLKMSVTFIF